MGNKKLVVEGAARSPRISTQKESELMPEKADGGMRTGGPSTPPKRQGGGLRQPPRDAQVSRLMSPGDEHAFAGGHGTARDLILQGIDLRGVQLAGLRADNVDLREADLREAALEGVKWTGCILRDALLQEVEFSEAVLRLCDLDGARLTRVMLAQARLENCTARGARFDGADLTGAVLTDTDFSRASFHKANLERVSASGAGFRGADLRGARLRNADLCDTDLRGADFTDADLDGADLAGADLRGVVGDHPALKGDQGTWGELPAGMRSLTETMAPIVREVLHSAGARGAIDKETTERLMAEAAARQGDSPRNAPSADTLKAVARVLEGVGDDALPALFGALQQPNGSEPPAAVKAMILRLRDELGLDETASAEDVLSRLLNRTGR